MIDPDSQGGAAWHGDEEDGHEARVKPEPDAMLPDEIQDMLFKAEDLLKMARPPRRATDEYDDFPHDRQEWLWHMEWLYERGLVVKPGRPVGKVVK